MLDMSFPFICVGQPGQVLSCNCTTLSGAANLLKTYDSLLSHQKDHFQDAEASLHFNISCFTDTIIKEVQKEEGKNCL